MRAFLATLCLCALGAAAGLPPTAPPARAQLREASPDPIPGRIEFGDIRATLTLITRPLPYRSSADQVRINYLHHAGDGTGRLFVADMHCCIRMLVGGHIWDPPFLDIKSIRGAAYHYGAEAGLTSFAFHPDYARPGRPGFGRLYTVHGEQPGSTPQSGAVRVIRSPARAVDHVDVLTEWRVSQTDPSRADPASRRELLRVEQPYSDQNMGLIAFNPGARPGTPDYGLLYIAMGAGGRYGFEGDVLLVEPHQLAQDPGTVFGAILRIDPLARGARPYGVPASNPVPLWGPWAPEVYAHGFRNPQRFAWDPARPGVMLSGDVGQAYIEEINLILPGRNYGWSRREGTFIVHPRDETVIYHRPQGVAEPPYEYPVAQYDHDEGRAVSGGFVNRGRRVPQLRGLYIFGDLANGRIFYVPVAEIQRGRRAVVRELRLVYQGREQRLTGATGEARAGLRFGQDEAGEIYLLARVGNFIFRLDP